MSGNVETDETGRIVKIVTLRLPSPSKFRKRSRLGRVGTLLRGRRARVGRYELELKRESNYTAIFIYPILKKSKRFWTYDGYDVLESVRNTGPRVKQPMGYYLRELVAGEHKNNIKLSKEVIEFLDRLKELLID